MYMNKMLGFSTLCFVLLVAFYSNANYFIFAQSFSGVESASYLTIDEMIKIESQLAEKDLASNATTAKEHAEHVMELLKANDTKEINCQLSTKLNNTLSDFVKAFESGKPSDSTVKDKASKFGNALSDVVSARIDKQQLDNVTVKVLVVKDLVAGTLKNYKHSLGMSDANNDKNNNTSSSKSNQNNIMDEADYESAQADVSRAIELYNELKSSGNAKSIELLNALISLKDKIDSKSPFDQAEKIVEHKIITMGDEFDNDNLRFC